MKKSMGLIFICILFVSCGNLNSINFKPLSNINISNVKANISLYQVQLDQDNTMMHGEINAFRNVVRIILNFILLIFAILLITTTPVLLLFNWIIHFFICKKTKKTKRQLLKKYTILPKRFFKIYRNSYATLAGNSFGIVTWVLVSYLYIVKNHIHFQDGLIAYFNFPFKILNGIATNDMHVSNIIDSNLWIEMLFIVGLSILNFLLGYTIVRWVLNYYKKNTEDSIEETQFIYPQL